MQLPVATLWQGQELCPLHWGQTPQAQPLQHPSEVGYRFVAKASAARVSMEGQKLEKAVALETILAAVTQLVSCNLLPSKPAVLRGCEPQTGWV